MAPTRTLSASNATAAASFVRSRGFTPKDTNDFENAAPDGLHVIVASASGSPGGHVQRAFFFIGSRFIRTDLVSSSATIQVAWRNDTTIGLSYATYKPADKLCCPSGGGMIVRYQWTGTRLRALDPIPPPAARR